MNITGLKSWGDIFEAIDILASLINVSPAEIHYQIDNFTAGGDLGFEIDLALFQCFANNAVIQYNPETFPGLFMKHGEITFILFSSGRVNIVGARKYEEVQESFYNIQQIIQSFSKRQDDTSGASQCL